MFLAKQAETGGDSPVQRRITMATKNGFWTHTFWDLVSDHGIPYDGIPYGLEQQQQEDLSQGHHTGNPQKLGQKHSCSVDFRLKNQSVKMSLTQRCISLTNDVNGANSLTWKKVAFSP